MRTQKKTLPTENVVIARRKGDAEELSRAGKAGAKEKREIKERRINRWLSGAWEAAQERNEHICKLN